MIYSFPCSVLFSFPTFNSHPGHTNSSFFSLLWKGKQGGNMSCIIISFVCIQLAFPIYLLVSFYHWNVSNWTHTKDASSTTETMSQKRISLSVIESFDFKHVRSVPLAFTCFKNALHVQQHRSSSVNKSNKDREWQKGGAGGALKNHSCSCNDFLLLPLTESHFLLLLTNWPAALLTGHCLTPSLSCTDRQRDGTKDRLTLFIYIFVTP